MWSARNTSAPRRFALCRGVESAAESVRSSTTAHRPTGMSERARSDGRIMGLGIPQTIHPTRTKSIQLDAHVRYHIHELADRYAGPEALHLARPRFRADAGGGGGVL